LHAILKSPAPGVRGKEGEGNLVEAAREIFGRWLPVATAVGGVALPGVPAAPAVIQLIAALVDPEGGQGSMLSSIKADTSALRKAPFRTAMQSLNDALLVGPADPLWLRYIYRAEAKFSEALELASDMPEKALIEFNLGIVFMLIGHRVNTRRHLELSRQHAEEAVNHYARHAYNLFDARERRTSKRWPLAARIAILPATPLILVGGGLYALAALPYGKSQARKLREFIGLYNLIQRAWESVGGGEARYLAVGTNRRNDGDSYYIYFLKPGSVFPKA
jgi:hypothetical protein